MAQRCRAVQKLAILVDKRTQRRQTQESAANESVSSTTFSGGIFISDDQLTYGDRTTPGPLAQGSAFGTFPVLDLAGSAPIASESSVRLPSDSSLGRNGPQLPTQGTRKPRSGHEASISIPPHQFPGHSLDSLAHKRQLAATEYGRFRAFVSDSFGSYAPCFAGDGHSRLPSDSVAARQAPSSAIGNSAAQPNVSLESRRTRDLEKESTKIGAEDLQYLNAKGAFDLPNRRLQEEMVDAFFTWVHPLLPVLNRTSFLKDFRNNKPLSLLLLFAVFTAGCKGCRNPLLMDKWGTNISSGRYYYNVTKTLLNTNYEPDKLIQIQALLLITWWWDKKDDGGQNMRGCAVNALNMAECIGMNRWDQYPRSDRVETGLWKRVWWGCIVRDCMASTAHGLPRASNLLECDVPALEFDDFVEEGGFSIGGQVSPYTLEEMHFYMEEITLCDLMGDIFSQLYIRHRLQATTRGSLWTRIASPNNTPGQSMQGTYPRVQADDGLNNEWDQCLQSWYSSIPPELEYDVNDVQSHRFLRAFLQVLFFTIICIRYRIGSLSDANCPKARYSRTRGFLAATMITKVVRNLKSHDQIMKCPGFLYSTHSLFLCQIFHMMEAQEHNPVVTEDAQRKYTLCLNTLYDFSQLWISASLIHRLFEALQSQLFKSHKQIPLASGAPAKAWYPAGVHTSEDLGEIHVQELLADRFSLTEPQDRGDWFSSGVQGPAYNYSASDLQQLQEQYDPMISQGDQPFPDSLDVYDW
ncbi:hypothetical protein AYO22_11728 [Fonsecaea multimorphosa]|nr:hypothetical protein AYO22_11728 [Fonsecaea multimorphosa]